MRRPVRDLSRDSVHFGGRGADLGGLGGFSEFFRTIFGDLGVGRTDIFEEEIGGRRGRGPTAEQWVRPHPVFERKGDDLHMNLPVTVAEAALGAEVEVPTLKGKVALKIPPGTSSGRTFRLRGYGMPRLKGGGAGDLYVRTKIVVPSGLSVRERQLFEELKRLRPENPRAGPFG